MTYYYKARRKKSGVQKGVTGSLLIASSFVLLWGIAAPASAGKFGEVIHEAFFRFSGAASFLVPLFMVWLGVRQFVEAKASRLKDIALFMLLFLSAACFLSLFHTASDGTFGGLGGWVGDSISLFLIHQFGSALVGVFSFVSAFVSGCLLLRISPAALIHSLNEKISEDLAHWREEKAKAESEKALKKKIEKAVEKPGKEPKESKDSASKAMPQINEHPPVDLGKILDSKLKNLAKKSEPAVIDRQAQRSASVPQISKLQNGKVPVPGQTPDALQAEQVQIPVNPYENYILPDPELLTMSDKPAAAPMGKEELYANGTHLEQTLEQFGVKAKVIDIHPGPVITRYDLSPAPGVRVQQIESLSDDIALAMKAQSLRVLAPVPGKAAVGIEISNSNPAMVFLKEMILSSQYQTSKKLLPIAFGKTTEGDAYVADLATMPHLLIAGATGSGKSVCIHAVILSILFKFRPDEVKLLLIDPKRLELPAYGAVPHLYDPAEEPQNVKVVTNPKDVVLSLKKLIEVMDARYVEFAKFNVRNIEGYNEKARAQNLPKAAYLVVIIDELADLMVLVGKEIEEMIQRLAQMARAVGIHLILATQRPSVDVITGVIKANLPSRVAFQVLSKTDSRVILDCQGAEDLLGRGDMLFLATGAPKPARLQGAFVSETDVNRVIQFIKEQNFQPSYLSNKTVGNEDSIIDNPENKWLLVRAARVVKDTEKVSGDLLRADKEIGSRYDLALTLLKKKGLIEKPKDTNRWKVHWDLLNEYLAEIDQEP